jgi:3',5'-cyclic AMP phosphodiesterase CpdA
VTIAFASDFHLGLMTAPGFLDDFAAKVNALNPDFVLIGGDVFEGRGGLERMDEFASGFKRLRRASGSTGSRES